jgi:hypothetical protein
MAEGIEHALVRQDAVGDAKFLDDVGQVGGHGRSSICGSGYRLPSAA